MVRRNNKGPEVPALPHSKGPEVPALPHNTGPRIPAQPHSTDPGGKCTDVRVDAEPQVAQLCRGTIGMVAASCEVRSSKK